PGAKRRARHHDPRLHHGVGGVCVRTVLPHRVEPVPTQHPAGAAAGAVRDAVLELDGTVPHRIDSDDHLVPVRGTSIDERPGSRSRKMNTGPHQWLAGKGILVTGGLGALGTVMVQRLTSSGATVIINDLAAEPPADAGGHGYVQ